MALLRVGSVNFACMNVFILFIRWSNSFCFEKKISYTLPLKISLYFYYILLGFYEMYYYLWEYWTVKLCKNLQHYLSVLGFMAIFSFFALRMINFMIVNIIPLFYTTFIIDNEWNNNLRVNDFTKIFVCYAYYYPYTFFEEFEKRNVLVLTLF